MIVTVNTSGTSVVNVQWYLNIPCQVIGVTKLRSKETRRKCKLWKYYNTFG